MGFEDYISETEAASFSGVSVATLSKFVLAGYLKVESDSDGLRLFSKSELRNVFGLDNFSSAAGLSTASASALHSKAAQSKTSETLRPEIIRRKVAVEPYDEEVTASAVSSSSISSPITQSHSNTVAHSATQAAIAAAKEAIFQKPILAKKEPVPEETQEAAEHVNVLKEGGGAPTESDTVKLERADKVKVEAVSSKTQEVLSSKEEALVKAQSPTGVTTKESPIIQLSPEQSINQEKISKLEMELEKLRTLNQAQERMLAMKEERIKDVEEQKIWLKARLEKLEEKAERDQLLLLAESQTVRQLIQIQEQKKSPVRLMLEWLGITPPGEPKHTIEIGHKEIST